MLVEVVLICIDAAVLESAGGILGSEEADIDLESRHNINVSRSGSGSRSFFQLSSCDAFLFMLH